MGRLPTHPVDDDAADVVGGGGGGAPPPPPHMRLVVSVAVWRHEFHLLSRFFTGALSLSRSPSVSGQNETCGVCTVPRMLFCPLSSAEYLRF